MQLQYDKVPTRKDISGFLNMYLENELSFMDLHNYGDEYFVCENDELELNDNLILHILSDIVGTPLNVENYPSADLVKRLIRMLSETQSEIKELVEYKLCYDNNKKGLAYLLTDYSKGEYKRLEEYIREKFNLRMGDFPFQEIIRGASESPDENIKLIENTCPNTR